MQRIKYKKSRNVQPNYYEYTGVYKQEPVQMQLFVYDDAGYEEYQNVSLQRIKAEVEDPDQDKDVKWLNVHGLHDVAQIRTLGEQLDLEPFIISDILNVARRSKIEELDEVLFFSIKSILPLEKGSEEARVEQISFVLQDNLLVSFQEKRSDFFTHIRERIKTHSGIVRKKKADYLLFLLLESVMENFYITIESYEDQIEQVLAEAKRSDDSGINERIQKLRERLNFLKRAVKPLHDALSTLKNASETQFENVEQANFSFFARLNQKSLELLEQIEYDLTAVETASNFYFASQSRRMNEIMKVLTGVSVVFMPLTFIVGVYGMNFDFMPELRFKYGYFVVMGVMLLLVIGMVAFFKKKKWI